MSLTSGVIGFAERVPLPDFVIRAAIHQLCSRTAARLAVGDAASDADFAREMAARAVAEHTEAANAQHYEVPAAFFGHVLGPNRKYSSCFYRAPASTLQEAEEEALRQSVDHADLADGQSILELGCGWGSLSLWMARQFPNSKVVAVSNSHSQRMHIQSEGAARGLTNLSVMTADMNGFDPERRFDRIVSVEMFEHMMNWRELLGRARSWLEPQGRLFMHIFTHRAGAYLFDCNDKADWIARHFFTGGVMPSHLWSGNMPICSRSRRSGAGAANTISAPRWAGLPISTPIAARSKLSCAAFTARIPRCGCGAGAGSFLQLPAFSVFQAAANGA